MYNCVKLGNFLKIYGTCWKSIKEKYMGTLSECSKNMRTSWKCDENMGPSWEHGSI